MTRWLPKLWRLPLRPKTEWDDIAQGDPSMPHTLLGYLLPAAGITALCGFIGMHLVGVSLSGFSYKVPLTEALTQSAAGFVAGILATFVLAWIADFLAPRFQASRSYARAFAVAAFAAAPVHLIGVTQVFPLLALLLLPAALYSLYLLHLGLQRLMQPEASKALPYSLSVVGCAILLGLLLALLRGCTSSTPGPQFEGARIQVDGELEAEATADAEGRAVAAEELTEEEKQVVDALRKMGELPQGEGGDLEIPPSQASDQEIADSLKGVLIPDMQAPSRSVLEEYLPREIAGMKRKTVDSYAYRAADPNSAAAFLSTGASASVGFQSTDGRWNYIHTSITDMTRDKAGVMIGALKTELSMVGPVQRSDDGKVRRIGFDQGRWYIITETDRRNERTLEWIVGERYTVKVEAKGYAMEDLERIAASMGIAELEKRAKDKAPIE